MLDGWTRSGSNGSTTMRPASTSWRIVRSLRTTAALYPARRRSLDANSLKSGGEMPIRGPKEMKMPTSGPGDHQLKRIVLPSGKTIEVVYFDHASFADSQAP